MGCVNPNEQALNNQNQNHQNGGAIKLNALLLKYFPKIVKHINKNNLNKEYLENLIKNIK